MVVFSVESTFSVGKNITLIFDFYELFILIFFSVLKTIVNSFFSSSKDSLLINLLHKDQIVKFKGIFGKN